MTPTDDTLSPNPPTAADGAAAAETLVTPPAADAAAPAATTNGAASAANGAASTGNGAASLSASPEAAPAPEPAPADDPARRLADLEARHAEVSEAYLRAKAETENVRRRADDEMAKARKFAVEGFAESLLPVKDSLEAAIANAGANREQVIEGVQATLKQLTAALERNKVVEISPAPGARFDPHQHQAISLVPADQEANTVVGVLQKGYLIAERVLRPALVTVAAPK